MKERFEFIVEGEERDGVPVLIAVRRWLKEGKRRFGLTCTEGRQVEADEHTINLEGEK